MALELLILLAIIQGITEFLPISSSAHLILPSQLGFMEDQGLTIDVAVHVGSLFAVMIYFRQDVVKLFVGLWDAVRLRWTWEAKIFTYLAAATIPIIIVGGIISVMDWEDGLRSAEIIGWTSIIFGLVLYESDRIAKKTKKVEDVTWTSALLIGASQILSVLPGTSRSGVTITAARFLGFQRSEAARFSMLLAIPTILIIGAVKGKEVIETGDSVMQANVAWSLALSFASAYAAIWVFMQLVDKIGLLPFVIYRVVLGLALLTYVYYIAV